MSQPKWTPGREDELRAFVGDEDPVTQATVHEAAEALGTSARSISSKLRKLEYEVEKAGTKPSRFTATQESALRTLVEGNSGKYTYAQLARAFEDGEFTPKEIQGKILSMQLTSHVAPAPKPETVKTYTDEEEETFISMANAGAFIEEIAESLGKRVQSIRGKALSLFRAGVIDAIPKQKETTSASKVDPLSELGDVSGMKVTEIAEKIGKTPRGVKTMLTRRQLKAADYDGAAKAAKAASN